MRTSTNIPNSSQEKRVLYALIDRCGEYVSRRYFAEEMMLKQYGRAIINVEKLPRWLDEAKRLGVRFEKGPKEMRDEYGFNYIRVVRVDPIPIPPVEIPIRKDPSMYHCRRCKAEAVVFLDGNTPVCERHRAGVKETVGTLF